MPMVEFHGPYLTLYDPGFAVWWFQFPMSSVSLAISVPVYWIFTEGVSGDP